MQTRVSPLQMQLIAQASQQQQRVGQQQTQNPTQPAVGVTIQQTASFQQMMQHGLAQHEALARLTGNSPREKDTSKENKPT